jgi:hypothetical protein
VLRANKPRLPSAAGANKFDKVPQYISCTHAIWITTEKMNAAIKTSARQLKTNLGPKVRAHTIHHSSPMEPYICAVCDAQTAARSCCWNNTLYSCRAVSMKCCICRPISLLTFLRADLLLAAPCVAHGRSTALKQKHTPFAVFTLLLNCYPPLLHGRHAVVQCSQLTPQLQISNINKNQHWRWMGKVFCCVAFFEPTLTVASDNITYSKY